MSYKEEYARSKREYDSAKRNIDELKAKQKVAKSELRKVEDKIKELTKGRDAEEVLSQLEKEIETRLEMVREKVREFESLVVDTSDHSDREYTSDLSDFLKEDDL